MISKRHNKLTYGQTNRRTNGPTDQLTNRPCCRYAMMHPKKRDNFTDVVFFHSVLKKTRPSKKFAADQSKNYRQKKTTTKRTSGQEKKGKTKRGNVKNGLVHVNLCWLNCYQHIYLHLDLQHYNINTLTTCSKEKLNQQAEMTFRKLAF